MRIFHYSHDTYGLGHIRRTLAIAEQIASDFPQSTQLLVSGTPQPSCFKLPGRLDFIKLPDIDKPSNRKFHAPSLLLPFDALKTLREKIILDAIRHFKPDVVLVDKSPAGFRGEMLPSLHYLKHERPETKLVLGICDIEDNAMVRRSSSRSEINPQGNMENPDDKAKIRDHWRGQGIYSLMEDQYDLILHYGNREIYDPVSEYRLSRKVESKMISCGYIGHTAPAAPKKAFRHALDMKTNRLVVVTAGGGDDGFKLLNFYLKTLSSLSKGKNSLPFDSLVISGPLMSVSKRRQLQSYQSMDFPFILLGSTPDMFSYLNAADLVVSMGGYNTLCEILSLRKRAIIVPHIKPRLAQLIRAGRFASHGLVEMIHPKHLTSATLLKKIFDGLDGGAPAFPEEVGLDLNGALNASRAITQPLKKKAPINIIDISSHRKRVRYNKVFSHRIYADRLSAFS